MRWSRFIVAIVSGSVLTAASVITIRYIERRSEALPFPSAEQENAEPSAFDVARQTYFKLPPSDVQRLLSGNCAAIREPGELPESIKNAFATLTSDKPFALAAPGMRFNDTDVIEPGLPRRRLVFGGHCDDRWFIEYEHGGIAKSFAVMVLRINPNQSVTLLWGRALRKPAPNLAELRNVIARNEFWEAPYFW